jgi:hypothetical protein
MIAHNHLMMSELACTPSQDLIAQFQYFFVAEHSPSARPPILRSEDSCNATAREMSFIMDGYVNVLHDHVVHADDHLEK